MNQTQNKKIYLPLKDSQKRQARKLWLSLTVTDRLEMLARAHPAPSFQEFVEKTTNFQLHEWQKNHLVPLLESLVDTPTPNTQDLAPTTPKRAKRILIHAPPQFGKSILVSKRFPAWALGKNPLLRIILAGYNVGHAASFCEVVRDIMAGQT